MDLPRELIGDIQSYLNFKSYLTTRTVSHDFSQPYHGEETYKFTNPHIKLPRYITRVILGSLIENWQIEDSFQLKELELHFNTKISDEGILILTNLNVIALNDNITEKGLFGKRIENIALETNKHIDSDVVRKLVHLKVLNCQDSQIDDSAIENLALETIYLNCNTTITDRGIKHMNLKELALDENTNITDNGISHMTNMTQLFLGKNKNITNKGIENMLRITYLGVDDNKNITRKLIDHLFENGKLKKRV